MYPNAQPRLACYHAREGASGVQGRWARGCSRASAGCSSCDALRSALVAHHAGSWHWILQRFSWQLAVACQSGHLPATYVRWVLYTTDAATQKCGYDQLALGGNVAYLVAECDAGYNYATC
jgi:hypothetical protein